MAFHSPRSSQGQFSFNPATPPLPPPKPSAHSSGTATPQAGGPPLPPPPPGQEGVGETSRYASSYQPGQPSQYAQQMQVVEPPPEGWLPDIVKDKK